MTQNQQTLEELREALARVESGQTPPGGGLFGDDAQHDSRHRTDAWAQSGDASEVDSAEEPPQRQYDKARAVVLRKLTGSAKSRHQLAEALRERDFGEDTISEVLDRMEEVNLLDDADFARTWVRTRHEIKGLGRNALRYELKARGVLDEHIEPALEQLSSDEEETAARAMVEKKLEGRPVPAADSPEGRSEREKLMRRLVSMLARRGHSPGAAFQVVRDVLQERTSA